jgi:uncharacterized membrane protein
MLFQAIFWIVGVALILMAVFKIMNQRSGEEVGYAKGEIPPMVTAIIGIVVILASFFLGDIGYWIAN